MKIHVVIIPILIGLGVSLTPPAIGAEAITITATKKTADQRKGQAQALPRGSTRVTSKDVFYRFDLQRTIPGGDTETTVEWAVMVEGAGGQFFPGTTGKQKTALPFGQKVTVDSGLVTLMGREWQTRQKGSISDSVAGYGIRITNEKGALVGEKYYPTTMKQQIHWDTIADQRDNPVNDLMPKGPRAPLPRPFRRLNR